MAVDAAVPTTSPANEPTTVAPAASKHGKELTAFADADGASFYDLLDVINPLQHLPIITGIYQRLTGDKQGAVAEVAGGILFGGLFGLVGSIVNLAVEGETGSSIDEHVLALFDDDTDQAKTQLAANDSKPANGAKTTSGGHAAGMAMTPPSEAAVFAAFGATPAADAQSTASGPVQSGDYLVFGGPPVVMASLAAADAPRIETAAAAKSSTDPAAVAKPSVETLPTAKPSADPVATATQPTSGAKFFKLPARGGDARPPMALPQPTTGRGAVAGTRGQSDVVWHGRSQPAAETSSATAAAGQTLPAMDGVTFMQQDPPAPAALAGTAPNGAATPWFAEAFKSAMDKYEKAGRLGASATAPTQGAGEAAAGAQ